MEVVFGIAVLEIVFFWVMCKTIGLNLIWIIITEIVVVVAIATLHIESVIRTELRNFQKLQQEDQDDDEIK